MFIWDVSIIIVLICQKLGSIRPVQEKIKLPLLSLANKYVTEFWTPYQRKDVWVHLPALVSVRLSVCVISR